MIGLNLFPGTDPAGNNDAFYALLGNTLKDVAPVQAVPEPASLTLIGLGAAGLLARAPIRRRRPV